MRLHQRLLGIEKKKLTSVCAGTGRAPCSNALGYWLLGGEARASLGGKVAVAGSSSALPQPRHHGVAYSSASGYLLRRCRGQHHVLAASTQERDCHVHQRPRMVENCSSLEARPPPVPRTLARLQSPAGNGSIRCLNVSEVALVAKIWSSRLQ